MNPCRQGQSDSAFYSKLHHMQKQKGEAELTDTHLANAEKAVCKFQHLRMKRESQLSKLDEG
jgi:hypothetical protein